MKKIITLIFCIGQMFFGIAQSCSPLDSSFGTNGSAVGLTTSNTGINIGNIIVQPDNKIVQVGGKSGNEFTVIRYTSNGIIDNSFGQNGKAIASVGGYVYSQYGALQNDGKIVVAGVAYNNNTLNITLVRFNNNGTLDNSFGTGGKVISVVIPYSYTFLGLSIQPDGKILVGGSSTGGCINDCLGNPYCPDLFTVIRYNADGSMDNSFGANGKVVTPVGPENKGAATCVVLQQDGKIVVGGHSNFDYVCDDYYGGFYYSTGLAIVRYNSNGSIDNTFGQNGIITGNSEMAGINAMAIQGDGKVVVTGQRRSGGWFAARYNGDGTPDNSFGQGGIVNDNSGYINSLVIDPNGKIVLAGSIYRYDNNFLTCKLQTNGAFDNSFNGNGKVSFHLGQTSGANASGVAIQEGHIIIGGGDYYNNSNNSWGSDVVVARLRNIIDGLAVTISSTGLLYPCPGEPVNVKLKIDQTGTIQWYNNGNVISGATGTEYNVTVNGNYSATVVNSMGCGESETVSVNINGLPVVITSAGSLNVCAGDSIRLVSNESGTIQWYSDNGTGGDLYPVIGANDTVFSYKFGTNYSNTTYFRFSVSVKNAKGCGSSLVNVTVNPSRPPIHWNGTLLNTVSGYYNYQWYLNSTPITGANGNNFQPAQTGLYKVAIGGYNCDTLSDEFDLECSDVNLPKPVINWNGTQLTTTTGLAGYQWLLNGNVVSGATTSILVPTQTGVYKVTIKGVLGCTNTSDEFNLDCNTIITTTPTVSWNGTQLSTTSGYAGYQWWLDGNVVPGITTSILKPIQTGIYKVTVTGILGCTKTSGEFNLNCSLLWQSKPVIDWDGTKFSTSPGFASYQWYQNDIAISGATTNTFIPATSQFGMYKVTIMDNNNCSGTSEQKPYQFTAVNDITIGDATLRYYPNPARTVLYIDVPQMSTKKMTAILYDLGGKKSVQQVLKRGQNLVPVRHLSSGLYQLEIQYGLEKIALKVVVIK